MRLWFRIRLLYTHEIHVHILTSYHFVEGSFGDVWYRYKSRETITVTVRLRYLFHPFSHPIFYEWIYGIPDILRSWTYPQTHNSTGTYTHTYLSPLLLTLTIGKVPTTTTTTYVFTYCILYTMKRTKYHDL